MFLIRTLLSQGTILCIILLLVTLDVGFSTDEIEELLYERMIY